MPVIFSCQLPLRGDTERASKPSTSVQKRTALLMSDTVKLVWLKLVIIALPQSSETIGGPAAVHFQSVARDIGCAPWVHQIGDPLSDLLLGSETREWRASLNCDCIETASICHRAGGVIPNI